jgi:Kef-type K+ transport system membrane component KefB
MDLTFFLIALIGVIGAIGITAITLWMIIPRAFQALEKWQKNKNPRYFSVSVFCFFAAFSLLSLVLKLMIQSSLKIEIFFSFRYERLSISLFLTFLLIYLLLPKTLIFFEKWRSTKKASCFSLSLLFAFLSTYVMLFMYILNTPVFLR